jgi:hypothetical protein
MALDRRGKLKDDAIAESKDGGALVSTWGMRQRRHAEDGSLASLKIEPNKTANQELALAA